MADDIVARLRVLISDENAEDLAYEAAVEIERLGNENDRLWTALRQIAETPDHYTIHTVRTHAIAALLKEMDDD